MRICSYVGSYDVVDVALGLLDIIRQEQQFFCSMVLGVL